MIWILIAIITCAAFGHIIRYAQHKGGNLAWIGAWNYLAAAAASWLLWVAQGAQPLTQYAVCFGTLSGLSLMAAYFATVPCIRKAGVGISQAAVQLSVILPIVASIFIWGEKPGLVASAGLLLILVAFPLLAFGKAVPQSVTGGSFWLLLILFATEGLVGLLMKAYSQKVHGQEAAFMCFVFSAASIGTGLAAIRQGRPARADLPYGIALGLVNVLANVGFLVALERAPAYIVFPSISIGSILLASLIAVFLWAERYRGKVVWGMALAILALILINIPY